jgi:hypothetical protein
MRLVAATLLLSRGLWWADGSVVGVALRGSICTEEGGMDAVLEPAMKGELPMASLR